MAPFAFNPGGYEDWTNQGGKWPEDAEVKNTKKEKPVDKKVNQSPPKTKKLSYKDQREFDQMPELIEQLESEVMALEEQVSDAKFYSQPPEVTGPVLERLMEAQEQLNRTYDRWVELEGLQE